MGRSDLTEGIARIAGALGSRRRELGAAALVLAFLALFPGSSPRSLAANQPAIGGAAFPESLGGLRAAAGVGKAVMSAAAAAESMGEDRGLFYTVYSVSRGDTIGDLADRFGVTTDSIVSLNSIANARAIQPGQLLKIPSQAGILYAIKAGDSLASVASAYSIPADSIVEANGLMSEQLAVGSLVFLPDARLPSFKLREINGDLFRWPVFGDISSRYGWRTDPFSGARSFHNGLDIATYQGRPVYAAMEGRIADTGYSPTFGNYILIAHHSGYASFYGHLSAILVAPGKAVALGEKIGLVGSTGYSTGPHLHFTVFKNGNTVNPANLLH